MGQIITELAGICFPCCVLSILACIMFPFTSTQSHNLGVFTHNQVSLMAETHTSKDF